MEKMEELLKELRSLKDVIAQASNLQYKVPWVLIGIGGCKLNSCHPSCSSSLLQALAQNVVPVRSQPNRLVHGVRPPIMALSTRLAMPSASDVQNCGLAALFCSSMSERRSSESLSQLAIKKLQGDAQCAFKLIRRMIDKIRADYVM